LLGLLWPSIKDEVDMGFIDNKLDEDVSLTNCFIKKTKYK
jgi:hypothetical protein